MKFVPTRVNEQIAYDVLGAGAPIVMLHDFGESSAFWYEFGYVKMCLAQGRQVVLVDLCGHGDSSKPVEPGCGLIDCCDVVVAVLDHAGIRRADFLGYGFGGRIALCIAALAPNRVHAVAAGGSHPFAERMRHHRGVETSVAQIEEVANAAECCHGTSALAIAEDGDWRDVADAVAGSGVPILLFVGKEDPRYPLALSFAEQSGARIIVLPKQDHATAAVAAGRAELLRRILKFFDAPEESATADRLPPCLWSGSWSQPRRFGSREPG